ncbi:hypothetical protein AAG570_006897, partial [Ranatra chinensis]
YFVDLSSILVEFLEVAIHNIIYVRKIYPEGIFTMKKKYNAPIYVSMYPDLNKYISNSLTAIKHLIEQQEIKRVDVCFFNLQLKPIERFSFVFTKLSGFLMESDSPSLNQIHENFRAFCLKLYIQASYLKELPKGTTFRIQIHTNESSSVSLAENPSFQVDWAHPATCFIYKVRFWVDNFLIVLIHNYCIDRQSFTIPRIHPKLKSVIFNSLFFTEVLLDEQNFLFFCLV